MPDPRADGAPFDPRAVAQRFDLARPADDHRAADDRSRDARRLRWLDVHIRDHARCSTTSAAIAPRSPTSATTSTTSPAAARARRCGTSRASTRPARANIVYVRGAGRRDHYRRRDGETPVGRLTRLLAGEHDGALPAIPAANAPTWFALLRDDLAIPAGSAGYLLDARRTSGEGLTRAAVADLLADLAPRTP